MSSGSPAANIQDPTTTCGAKLVAVSGPAVDKLIKEYPYFAAATIPGGVYPNNPRRGQDLRRDGEFRHFGQGAG